MLQIGDTIPDLRAQTTAGRLRFHASISGSWPVPFSHPTDSTPACTTELGYLAKPSPEFDRRDVKIIGQSVDPAHNHAKWAGDAVAVAAAIACALRRARVMTIARQARPRCGINHATVRVGAAGLESRPKRLKSAATRVCVCPIHAADSRCKHGPRLLPGSREVTGITLAHR
jgi:hypothetical protein